MDLSELRHLWNTPLKNKNYLWSKYVFGSFQDNLTHFLKNKIPCFKSFCSLFSSSQTKLFNDRDWASNKTQNSGSIRDQSPSKNKTLFTREEQFELSKSTIVRDWASNTSLTRQTQPLGLESLVLRTRFKIAMQWVFIELETSQLASRVENIFEQLRAVKVSQTWRTNSTRT